MAAGDGERGVGGRWERQIKGSGGRLVQVGVGSGVIKPARASQGIPECDPEVKYTRTGPAIKPDRRR